MMDSLEIPAVTTLIADIWEAAEDACRSQIETKFWDPDEEFVTEIFYGEFRSQLGLCTESGQVAKAFFEDLMTSFPNCSREKMGHISADVVATVTKHSKSLECISGSDLGVVFVRPNISIRDRFCEDKKQGLLCQAKIRQRNGNWGALTKLQKHESLAPRLDYASLLLYDFDDKENRRLLRPFGWQLCANAAVEDVSKWLTNDRFPNVRESKSIIRALAKEEIGTSDTSVIDEVIAGENRPSLVIKIGWPDGDEPHRILEYLDSPMQRNEGHDYMRESLS